MATVPNYFLDAGAALPTNPFQSSMMDGLRFGATMQDFQAAQVKRQQEQQDRELKLQTQQRAQEQQAELQTLLSNPTPASTQELLRFSAFLPKDQSASVMAVYDKLTTQQQQSKLKQAGQIYASIKSGNLDVTKSLLQEQADGFRNNGNEAEAKAAETYIQMLGINPASAQNTIGLMMAVLPGGKEVLENIDKTSGTTRAEELQPTALRKAQAEATTAETEAKFAPQMAQATYQKLFTDTQVAKQNARINAMNAQISREGNDLKRQELQLKVQEARQKMDSTIREKAAEIDTARTSMDNMLNTADRILSTPKSVIGSAAGPVSSRIPTTTQSTADFEALVETLGSQAFMAQIPNLKGMGALSNAEGEKLQAALQNFSLKQSPEQLVRNVKEAQRLILKARITLASRYGVEENLPDRPAMPTNVAPAAGQRNISVDY